MLKSMAETNNKRNSVSGKVATPKGGSAAAPPSAPSQSSSPHPMQASQDALSIPVGARIQVRTIQPHNRTHEGILFAVDRRINLIAINCATPPPSPSTPLVSLPGDYHLIPIKSIQSFQILSSLDHAEQSGKEGATSNSRPSGKSDHLAPISQQELIRLRDREQKAVQRLKEEESKRGKGVSPEIQELFNVLDRLYTNQVFWDGKSIILMEAVRLDPPYGPDNLKAPKEKAGMLPQLRRVVEGETRKIASRVGTPPVSGRKGG